LAGNDEVYVGPTVQRTVWIDAGAGDDKVVISSGNAILVDKAELGKRNDLPQYATVVADDPAAADPVLTASRTLEGLTIDNPEDLDWFRFRLSAQAAPPTRRSCSQRPTSTASRSSSTASGRRRDHVRRRGRGRVLAGRDRAGGAGDSCATAFELKEEQRL
jgi:hypothetical protein